MKKYSFLAIVTLLVPAPGWIHKTEADLAAGTEAE